MKTYGNTHNKRYIYNIDCLALLAFNKFKKYCNADSSCRHDVQNHSKEGTPAFHTLCKYEALKVFHR